MKFLVFFILFCLLGAAGYWYFYYHPKISPEEVADNQPLNKDLVAWCFKDDCYWLNNEGILYDAAPRPDGGLVRVIDEISADYNLKVGKRVVDREAWLNLRYVINFLLLENELKTIEINRKKQEIIVERRSGIKMFFSWRFDPRPNIAALKERNLSGLDYVDLTVENRIYYK